MSNMKSLSSTVQNRLKLTTDRQKNRQKDRQTDREDKNNVPPIIRYRGIKILSFIYLL